MPVPTPTEIPELVLPVLAGTPLPRPSVALGLGNNAQVTALARWVQGSDPEFNHGLAFYSPDGRFLAVYSSDGIHLYNADSLTQARLIESPPAWRLTFSPDRKTLAAGLIDGSIKLWEIATGKELRTLNEQTVQSLAFSPDGRTLASSSFDNTIKLWNVATGQELRILSGLDATVESLAFSPDGRTLASGSYNGTIKLWDVAAGLELRILSGHSSLVESLAFSPDGRTLASGSDDDTIKLWDVTTGQGLRTLSGHKGFVASVTFSPDGTMLASGSYDDTIKLWNVTTGQELRALGGDTRAFVVNDVAFSPDGRTLVSAWDDGTICIWGVPPFPSFVVRPTSTAIPEPTQSPLPLIQVGKSITLTSLKMVNAAVGWGSEITGHIVRTTDGGQSWSDVTPPNLPADAFGSFFLNEQSAWIYNNNNPSNGLVHTADGGKSWTMLTRSMPAPYAILKFVNETDGWTEVDDVGAGHDEVTLFGTDDGGVTWNQIMLSDPPNTTTISFQPGDLSVCSICGDRFYYDPTRMLVVNGDLASDTSGSVRLSISFDLGKTWRKQNLPMPSSQYQDGSVAPQDPVFLNEQDGYLTFNIIKSKPDQSQEYCVLAIYATHNGGLTWIPNATVVENVDLNTIVDFVSLQDIFAACGNDLCATHDGAHTWQTLHSNLDFENVTEIYFASSSVGWAIATDGSSSGLWKTIDGGGSWTEISPTLIP
jgi:WD40 repeat protein